MRGAGAPLACRPELLRGCLQLPAAARAGETAGHRSGGTHASTRTVGSSRGSVAAEAAACRGQGGEGAESPAQQLLPGLSSSQLMGLPMSR